MRGTSFCERAAIAVLIAGSMPMGSAAFAWDGAKKSVPASPAALTVTDKQQQQQRNTKRSTPAAKPGPTATPGIKLIRGQHTEFMWQGMKASHPAAKPAPASRAIHLDPVHIATVAAPPPKPKAK